MFTETLKGHDDVIGIAYDGELTEGDLKRMHALLHERLDAANKPGLVVDLTNFKGYEGLAALREDLEMDTAHRNDFSRIAIICDQKWMERGKALAGFLTGAEMRWFDTGARDDATDWARNGCSDAALPDPCWRFRRRNGPIGHADRRCGPAIRRCQRVRDNRRAACGDLAARPGFRGRLRNSNPEHDGTTVLSDPKTPLRDGLRFRQEEYVGGMRGVLNAELFDVYPEEGFGWRAETYYSLWGLPLVTVEEGGVFRIEESRDGDSFRVSHRVWGEVLDTFYGRVLRWISAPLLDLESDAERHTPVKLEYFERQLEDARSGWTLVARSFGRALDLAVASSWKLSADGSKEKPTIPLTGRRSFDEHV